MLPDLILNIGILKSKKPKKNFQIENETLLKFSNTVDFPKNASEMPNGFSRADNHK